MYSMYVEWSEQKRETIFFPSTTFTKRIIDYNFRNHSAQFSWPLRGL